ncbi:MAG TPA: hypothetical protein H9808_03090, partial [Candidatus Atopostipes pullistercoris]|nr:hypothetical protein [Candidatus Atopostipes pullistercoris]
HHNQANQLKLAQLPTLHQALPFACNQHSTEHLKTLTDEVGVFFWALNHTTSSYKQRFPINFYLLVFINLVKKTIMINIFRE